MLSGILHRSASVALAGLVAISMTACGGGATSDAITTVPVTTPAAKLALKAFAPDCSDFLAATADALTEQYLRPPFHCPPGAMCPIAIGGPTAAGAPGAAGAPASADAPLRVSQTNTQEAGVDEPDIVRSDSQGNLYVLRYNQLLAFAGLPAAGLADRAVTTLTLGSSDNFYANDFFLDEPRQQLVIFGQEYASAVSHAVTLIASVADPLKPVIVGRLTVDGYGIDARRIGARVHRISAYYPSDPAWFYDGSDPLVQARQNYLDARDKKDQASADRIHGEVRTEIGKRVNDAGADAFLPAISTTLGGVTSDGHLACNRLSHSSVTMGDGMTVVDSFDTTGANRAPAAITSYAFLVYASADNLYLVQPSYGWFFADNQRDETAVFRLALSASGAPAYAGLGKVEGWIPNSYALSEFAGYLRVVTSSYRASGSSTESVTHLSILRTDAADMPLVGSVRNIAPGEILRGVRLLGDHGFLDTFRNVDPLFAFDLADPARPAVVDELTIPGFSSYMAPVGDNYLLTVGRAGDEVRLNHQVGIGLYDISDLHQVRQVGTLSPPAGGSSYSYSIAEYDPHAFNYFPDTAGAASPGTLSLPLQTYNSDDAADDFSGFMAIRVDTAAAQPLAELGRIDHRVFADTSGCTGGGGGGPVAGGGATTPPCYDSVYYTEPRRGVFMQEAGGISLFTFSDRGVIASDASAPATELGRRALPP